MDSFMGLKYARAHIILEVISGMTNPKSISKKNLRNKWCRDVCTLKKKGREISSGKVRRGSTCGPILVEIFATHEKIYKTGVRGAGKFSAENI